jgi:hypothetical protein
MKVLPRVFLAKSLIYCNAELGKPCFGCALSPMENVFSHGAGWYSSLGFGVFRHGYAHSQVLFHFFGFGNCACQPASLSCQTIDAADQGQNQSKEN